jgi:hypothetical protein
MEGISLAPRQVSQSMTYSRKVSEYHREPRPGPGPGMCCPLPDDQTACVAWVSRPPRWRRHRSARARRADSAARRRAARRAANVAAAGHGAGATLSAELLRDLAVIVDPG